jgi:hypothetical protein
MMKHLNESRLAQIPAISPLFESLSVLIQITFSTSKAQIPGVRRASSENRDDMFNLQFFSFTAAISAMALLDMPHMSNVSRSEVSAVPQDPGASKVLLYQFSLWMRKSVFATRFKYFVAVLYVIILLLPTNFIGIPLSPFTSAYCSLSIYAARPASLRFNIFRIPFSFTGANLFNIVGVIYSITRATFFNIFLALGLRGFFERFSIGLAIIPVVFLFSFRGLDIVLMNAYFAFRSISILFGFIAMEITKRFDEITTDATLCGEVCGRIAHDDTFLKPIVLSDGTGVRSAASSLILSQNHIIRGAI